MGKKNRAERTTKTESKEQARRNGESEKRENGKGENGKGLKSGRDRKGKRDRYVIGVSLVFEVVDNCSKIDRIME
ncbi:hypothetical protein [Haladaptatus sp. DYF46]|uniref:hypothetical protein n=1 Tax=Haladaptatus sp. DYF46 TaxID=2886041 RepID=UPI001E33AE37|nr:hypothetical protein [Haladaptatus sp. DYF46]